MVVDPDPINERQRTVDRSDLKMLGGESDGDHDLSEVADVDEDLTRQFDL